MSVIIKGFPTEIGEYIELPDMAELLCYPFFLDNYVEDIMKHGTEFQKYLIEKTPLRHDKKHISCRMEVKFVYPQSRSVTGYNTDGKKEAFEWHIDSDENQDFYSNDNDRVHLLTSANDCMTEFNRDEFQIDFNPAQNYEDFIRYIENNHAHQIVPQTIEPNRIITFTNHLHRATPSDQCELRFMYRVVETNRERFPSTINPNSTNISNVYDIHTGKWIPSIVKNHDTISLRWR